MFSKYLIQTYRLITNKVTRSFNMVLLGAINNTNRCNCHSNNNDIIDIATMTIVIPIMRTVLQIRTIVR